ncbi:MAG: hypothetical protein NTV32_10575 [Gammaproteobacteria bacterium]|nr:hypothetical protein [Gammaproteobacteria bacterium]
MAKLLAKAKSSKLSEITSNSSPDGVALSQKNKPSALIKTFKIYPRSYRFDYEVLNILQTTLDRVNELSAKKISEAKLVKALIFLSKDVDEMKIIKASKEVW